MVQRFQELEVWQKAHKLALEIYAIGGRFPREEMFGLTSQLKRAAISIPANIAEGFRRRTNKDFARFLVVSEGSLAEVEYYLILARDLGYIDDEVTDSFHAKLETISKMLGGLRRSMIQPHQAPGTKNQVL